MFQPDQLSPLLAAWRDSANWWVAYSGGLDSRVLLQALHTIAGQFPLVKLQAVHINHQLQPQALQWQAHCQQVCTDLGIPLRIVTIQVNAAPGESLEAAARQARYQAFSELLQAHDCLLTAQHQTDQAETLLLQLLRGAGPRGLAAMPTYSHLGVGYLLRPLLGYTRGSLQEYAISQQLEWVEDHSNQDLRFDRNYLRHQLWPHLQQRWPAVTQTLARSARHCAEAEQLLAELAEQDLAHCRGQAPHTLAIKTLLRFAEVRRRNILRYWLRQQGFSLPDTIHLERVEQEVLTCAADANPLVAWANVEVRRYRNDLYAMTRLAEIPQQYFPWRWDLTGQLPETLDLPGIGTLLANPPSGTGLPLLRKGIYQVTWRQGGERLQPFGRRHSHPLKKLMQDWGIPPWQRSRIPLLYQGKTLAAVVSYAIAEDFAALPGEPGWQLGWVD